MTTHPTHQTLTPTQLADRAAETIRSLNHATRNRDAWEWPSQVYATVGNLQLMAQRLPQAFDQIARWLDATNEAGRLGHDQDDTPNLSVLLAWTALASAEHHAQRLAESLATVHKETSHFTGIATDADTGTDAEGW